MNTLVNFLLEIIKTFVLAFMRMAEFVGNLISEHNYITLGIIFLLCCVVAWSIGKATKPSHKR